MTPLTGSVAAAVASHGLNALLVFLVFAALALPLAMTRDRLIAERRRVAKHKLTTGEVIDSLPHTTQTLYGLQGVISGDTFYTKCPLSSIPIVIDRNTHQDQFGRCYLSVEPTAKCGK
mgnify:CR=1 FL=1|tara:strand:- start:54 stop:407 length:354 start_codon:yes stop_codon:yes gene_type:complete